MNTTEYFKRTIQAYLEERAMEDEFFAAKYDNPDKNIDTRVRDIILKSKEQKNIQPTKGGHKMVTCQNYVSLFYCQITSCPSDGGIS